MRENYYVIHDWMNTQLKLKGAERDIYAIIYGYNRDGETQFFGSISYLEELTGYSRKCIIDTLKGLTERGLLVKTEVTSNNVKYCRYSVSDLCSSEKSTLGGVKSTLGGSEKITPPSEKITPPPSEKITPHNIYKDNIKDSIKYNSKRSTTVDKNYTKLIKYLEAVCLDDDLTEAICGFLEARKEVGDVMPLSAFEMQLDKLSNMRKEDAISSIHNSKQNGWKAMVYDSATRNSRTSYDVQHTEKEQERRSLTSEGEDF